MNNQEFQQLKREIAEIIAWKKSLESSSTIPLPIEQAFRDRFSADTDELALSTKSATSENRSVDEGGSATYDVMTKPDTFLEVTIEGITYYLPAFT